LPKLSQSRGFLRIEADILADGVLYKERGLLSSHEQKIPFEDLADDLVRSFHVPRLYLSISLFFALAFAYRLVRFLSTDAVSLMSLAWSGLLFIVPALGTWMQSPTYIGYLASRGGLLFFDTRGAQDPHPFLEEVQRAKSAYLRARYAGASEGIVGIREVPGRTSFH